MVVNHIFTFALIQLLNSGHIYSLGHLCIYFGRFVLAYINFMQSIVVVQHITMVTAVLTWSAVQLAAWTRSSVMRQDVLACQHQHTSLQQRL